MKAVFPKIQEKHIFSEDSHIRTPVCATAETQLLRQETLWLE